MSAKPIVLVIEGGPSEAESLISVLREQPFHTIHTVSSEDALAFLELPVDLVLSGIGVSDLEGLRLLESWRSRRPEIPYVLISNERENPDFDSAISLGAAGYIKIPAIGEAKAGEIIVSQIKTWLNVGTDSNDSVDQPNSLSLNDQEPHSMIQIPPGTTLEDLERVAVEQALREHQGNRTHAAKSLGISVRTLQRKLKAWHGSLGAPNSASPESRMNVSKMRSSNAWNGSQATARPMNLRSHMAKV